MFYQATQPWAEIHYNKNTGNVTISGQTGSYTFSKPDSGNVCGWSYIYWRGAYYIGFKLEVPNTTECNFPALTLSLLNINYTDSVSEARSFSTVITGQQYNTLCRGRNIVSRAWEYPSNYPTTRSKWMEYAESFGNQSSCKCGGIIDTGCIGNKIIVSEPPLAPAAPTISGSTIFVTTGETYNRISINNPDNDYVNYYSIQVLSGESYVEITKLYPSGDTYYYDYSTILCSNHSYKVVATNELYTTNSNIISIDTTITSMSSPLLTLDDYVISANTATFSWTRPKDYQQKHILEKKKTTDISYQVLATIEYPTDTYTDTDIDYNEGYNYRVRSLFDYCTSEVYSPYSNEVLLTTATKIKAPSGLTDSSVTCTAATLTWVNNNVSGQTGNNIYQYVVDNWDLIDTVASGDTTFNITGLTPNLLYKFKVCAYNDDFEICSEEIQVTTLNPAPFNIQGNLSYLQNAFTWSINDPAYGISIIPEIRISGNTTWISGSTLVKNATSYTFTGLSWNTRYEVRFVRIGSEYSSDIYSFTTPDFKAPSNLIATSVGDKQICLSWTNNTYNDSIDVYYKKEDTDWVVYETVIPTVTGICVNNLSMLTEYSFAIVNKYGSYTLSTDVLVKTTTVKYLPPFCEDGGQYKMTGTTCGNNDSIIQIEEDYTVFYDFVLQDIFGNSYTLTDYYWTGLTSSWYFITATPKEKYKFYYGNQSCYINWIEISDSNTPLILLSTKIRPQQCGPFDVQYGRIFYNITGLTSGNTYSFYAFTDDLKPYYSKTGITFTEDFLIANAMARCYYGVIIDEVSGCKLLLDIKCVPSVTIFSNNGIKKLYITPWTSNVDYNYWKSSDDDYFLEFEDTSFFTSTKMKEYISLSGGTLTWYKLPVERKVVSVSQKLNKVPQGYIFTDTLSVAISKANADKWTKISRIINPENKWIYVAEDSNGNIWTGGYLYGARIDTYSFDIGARGADNGYKLTFTCVSENKLLTSLDVNYFNNYIV